MEEFMDGFQKVRNPRRAPGVLIFDIHSQLVQANPEGERIGEELFPRQERCSKGPAKEVKMRSKLFALVPFFLVFLCLFIWNPSIGLGGEFELEGKITGINRNSREISVMGIDVYVPVDVMIDTPTGFMPFDDPGPAGLCDKGPSLSDPCRISLIGATGIIIGERDGTGVNRATSVFVEQAENVMLGTVTDVNGLATEFVLNGSGRVRINTPGSGIGDDRFEAIIYPANEMTVFGETGYPMGIEGSPAFPATTECLDRDPFNPEAGFIPQDPTLPCSIKVGDFVSVEGDFRQGNDGTWYLAAHTVEVGTAVLYTSADIGSPATFKDYLIVGRATLDISEKGSLFSARGFATNPTTEISLFAVEDDCSTLVTPTSFKVQPVDPDSGDWRVREVDVAAVGIFKKILARSSHGTLYCAGIQVTVAG